MAKHLKNLVQLDVSKPRVKFKCVPNPIQIAGNKSFSCCLDRQDIPLRRPEPHRRIATPPSLRRATLYQPLLSPPPPFLSASIRLRVRRVEADHSTLFGVRWSAPPPPLRRRFGGGRRAVPLCVAAASYAFSRVIEEGRKEGRNGGK